MQTTTEHLTPEAAQALMENLPEKIQLGLRTCAAQLSYPVEAVIEMAESFASPKAAQVIWTRIR